MADSAAMMFASQEVIAKRLMLVGNAGPKPRQSVKKEMRRMGTEKIRAGMQSGGAMAVSAMLASAQIGAAMWRLSMHPSTANSTKTARQISRAGAKILDSGLKPIARRTRSNAKRLRGSRLR